MLDSSLPLDTWTVIVGFLELADLSILFRTNNKILSTLIDLDAIYEQFAKRKFPLHFIDIYLLHCPQYLLWLVMRMRAVGDDNGFRD